MEVSMLADKVKNPFNHPLVPFGVFSVIILSMLVAVIGRGDIGLIKGGLFFVAGLLVWSFLEYVFHRFPLHHPEKYIPFKGSASGRHLRHHDEPKEPEYMMVPLYLSIPVTAVLLGVFLWFSPHLSQALALSIGTLAGYLFYEWVHYATHCYAARSKMMVFLKRYHAIHHLKDSQNYFGVTSPLWDLVFKTRPDFDRKKTVRFERIENFVDSAH